MILEYVALGLSFALAVMAMFAVWLWFERKRLKATIEAIQKEPTYDARELLHDLTEGAGLVKISRISPMDVFIRRTP